MDERKKSPNTTSAALADHRGHVIIRDAFADLPGVSRWEPGNAYCRDCAVPVAAEVERVGVHK